jgi:hypothetical protein
VVPCNNLKINVIISKSNKKEKPNLMVQQLWD